MLKKLCHTVLLMFEEFAPLIYFPLLVIINPTSNFFNFAISISTKMEESRKEVFQGFVSCPITILEADGVALTQFLSQVAPEPVVILYTSRSQDFRPPPSLAASHTGDGLTRSSRINASMSYFYNSGPKNIFLRQKPPNPYGEKSSIEKLHVLYSQPSSFFG